MRSLDDPFRCVDSILEAHRHYSPVVLVDMHAEATSEKIAMDGFWMGGSPWSMELTPMFKPQMNESCRAGQPILRTLGCAVPWILSSGLRRILS